MKKIIFSLIIIAISLASFAQVNYKTIKTHSENGTTLIRIGIDEPLIQNADGAYGFRMKAPIPFTSFAIGFDATDRNAQEGHFIVYYRTSQGENGQTGRTTTDISVPKTLNRTFSTPICFSDSTWICTIQLNSLSFLL